MKLSVIMPVFNEVDSLTQIMDRVLASPLVGELIIVDDVSTDGSREKILALADRDERIKVYFHDSNQGKGASVRTGIAHCSEDAVIIQDADLEYDPRDYGKLLGLIEADKADVVYGSRYIDQGIHVDQSLLYYLANKTITYLSNLFTGLNLSDVETCYKCFRRDVIQEMRLQENRFGIEVELTAKVAALGCRICETGISYAGRNHVQGKKITVRDGVEAIACIFRYSSLSRKNIKT